MRYVCERNRKQAFHALYDVLDTEHHLRRAIAHDLPLVDAELVAQALTDSDAPLLRFKSARVRFSPSAAK